MCEIAIHSPVSLKLVKNCLKMDLIQTLLCKVDKAECPSTAELESVPQLTKSDILGTNSQAWCGI